jgi:hypothetical protein
MLYPWWQLTVGELFKANASPISTNFGLLGTAFTIPFIWALNVISLLMLISSGIVMFIYSIIPTKAFSRHLLNFSYKKPLFSIVFFEVGLITVILVIQALLNISVPLVGSATVTLPDSLTQGLRVSLFLSAEFQWPFGVGVIAASLCIAARLYHKRIE